MQELVFSTRKKDFKIDWFSGTGAGGQHRNKHQNCCRLTHKDSGITTQCTEFKERKSNLKKAFHKIVPLLIDFYVAKDKHMVYDLNSNVVRTYNEPDNRVKDHETGLVRRYPDVIDGDIDEFIMERRLQHGLQISD